MTETERAVWLADRAGKLTASRMRDAMDMLKNGKPSQKRADYMRDLLAERITGLSTRNFVTPAMEWGLQQEDAAKAAYEAHTGNLIAPCGFYDHPEIDGMGATPDGLVDDGLIEIKCPTTGKYLDWWLAGRVVPDEHKPQMIAQLLCTGREWCDFVAYDPRVQSASRRLFVARYVPTAEERKAVEEAAIQFLAELDAMFELFTTKEAA